MAESGSQPVSGTGSSSLMEQVVEQVDLIAVSWLEEFAHSRKREFRVPLSQRLIKPYGSFALGVAEERSDLDVVFLAPDFVRRVDFFTVFIRKLQCSSLIQNVFPVENAFVPVIKFVCMGVQVDLAFAVLRIPTYPESEDELLHDETLESMDRVCLRSFNGYRVARFIINNVPDLKIFRRLLMEVKRWAKAKQICSNSCGFLGGVAWAILVARVCIDARHPKSVDELMLAFFVKYGNPSAWMAPVCLQESFGVPGCFRSTQHVGDLPTGSELLPIFTPCYPYQNAAHNITQSTRRHILERFQEAAHLLKQGNIMRDVIARPSDPTEYFTDFKYITAESSDSTFLGNWMGALEARFPRLLADLEKEPGMEQVLVFPNVIWNEYGSKEMSSVSWMLGFRSTSLNYGHSNRFARLLYAFKVLFCQHITPLWDRHPNTKNDVSFHCPKRSECHNATKEPTAAQHPNNRTESVRLMKRHIPSSLQRPSAGVVLRH